MFLIQLVSVRARKDWDSSQATKINFDEKLVKNLIQARKYLPKGYNFKIWDCKRTIKTQILITESIRKRLKSMHPKSSPRELAELVRKYCGKIRKDPMRMDIHQNGGAVDLTIVNAKNEELYMGTDHDDLTAKAATDYFENIKNPNLLEKEAKRNRRLLKKRSPARVSEIM